MPQEIGFTKVAIFKGKKVRKVVMHNNEWWFSVVDVAQVLTDSADAGAYWRKLKQRLKEEGSEVVTNCHGLKLLAPDGKMRETRRRQHQRDFLYYPIHSVVILERRL